LGLTNTELSALPIERVGGKRSILRNSLIIWGRNLLGFSILKASGVIIEDNSNDNIIYHNNINTVCHDNY